MFNRSMFACIAMGIVILSPVISFSQNATLELNNSTQNATPMQVYTITANVVNRSKTDVASGAVGFDNNNGSCVVSFGSIRAQGGSATGSCTLSGRALTAKVAFKGADGSGWFGLAGNGDEFEAIDINLNDQKP